MTAKIVAVSRAEGVLQHKVGDDVVVADPATGVAVALSGVAAHVWNALGERRSMSVDELACRLVGDLTTGTSTDASVNAGAQVQAVVDDLSKLCLVRVRRDREPLSGIGRRSAVGVGSLAAVGAISALTLPPAAAASSLIGAQVREFTCVDGPSSAGPGLSTAQGLIVGSSTTPRTVAFTVIGGGGASGAIATVAAQPTLLNDQTQNPGAGGAGGYITGVITLPAGPAVTLSVYVGCGGYDSIAVTGGGYPTSFSPLGHGGGGRGYNFTKDGTPDQLRAPAAGAGGGGSAIMFPGETVTTASIVAGGGGGGGNAGRFAQAAPNGGAGGGIGPGSAGGGAFGTGGGGGTIAIPGAKGSTAGSVFVDYDSEPGFSTLAGGHGGHGATTQAVLAPNEGDTPHGSEGGGGGGGYTGGGGGGGRTTLTSSQSGGGGGGAGYAGGVGVGGSYTRSGITITITGQGQAPVLGTYGQGGAPGNDPSGRVTPGRTGAVRFTATGGFTLT